MKIIINTRKFEKAMKETKKKANDGVYKAIVQACYLLHGDVVPNTPVNTGRLRSSIAVGIKKGKKIVGIVGTNVKYAPFIEFGTGIYAEGGRQTPWVYYADSGKYHGFFRTKGQKPKHMFTDAWKKDEKKIIDMVRRAVMRA